jgi:hypothetical protein
MADKLGQTNMVLGEYLILYRLSKPGVQILRVVHRWRALSQFS